MSLKHLLFASAYSPLRFCNSFLPKISGKRSPKLRVLLYHDIDPKHEVLFEAQLRWLSKSWQFVTPHQFSAMIDGVMPVQEDSLLLTFDDGFISNLSVTERILNPFGIQALFFIVSNFALLSDKDDCRGFIAEKMYPSLKPQDIPNHWKNMSMDNLKFLVDTGHAIGGHTANHKRLAETTSSCYEGEIIESADYLAQKLGITIEHFAYTFGDLTSFTPAALAVARSRFKYIHTGMRGDNSIVKNAWAIRRDSLSAKDSISLVGAFLEGGADILYSNKLKKYESWGNSNYEIKTNSRFIP